MSRWAPAWWSWTTGSSSRRCTWCDGAARVKVDFFDGTESNAQVVRRVPDHDMALLSAETLPDDLKAATLASSASLRPGDEVIAVGNPFGIPDSVSDGVVSGLGREYVSRQTGATLTNLIQFDAAVNPGQLRRAAGQPRG